MPLSLSDIRNFGTETGCIRLTAPSAPDGCFSQFLQQIRESLWSRCVPELSRNPSDISKAIFQNDISRFESWRPSQPLSSLWGMSALQESPRHFRGLARRDTVSAARFSRSLASTAQFGAPVSCRQFSISVFWGRDSVRICTRSTSAVSFLQVKQQITSV